MKIIKYIINDNDIPVLFSKEIVHNEIVQNVKSAGFLILKYDHLKRKFITTCFGESSSLEIRSDVSRDKKIIENFLNK